MHKAFVALILLCFLTVPATADVIKKHVKDAETVGSGRFTYLLWEVYDATLYAPKGELKRTKPFAMKLTYLRSATGVEIADKSAQEIRQVGFSDEIKLAAWHSQMRKIFPNVKKGMSLTGIYTPDAPTRFYKGSTLIGVIKDPAFGKWFFNIWLGPKSSEPKLRRQLLGQK